MRGTVLNFDPRSGSGVISGDDGARYSFKGTNVESGFERIEAGALIDFQADGKEAISIYPMAGATSEKEEKSKIAAGLLALFLGGLGIHKFYLGRNSAGVIMLLCTLVGFLLIIPAVIVLVIALIEGIIYLTKSDAAFQQTYVVGKKAWF
jgi:TM2 domain-containing membrane protein YozV/cold shock CspA family protein